MRDANLRGANLRDANLRGAYLEGANLRGAKIDGEEVQYAPIAVEGLHWWVLITDRYMRIGCQRHTHAEWAGFSDALISHMDSHATTFWTSHKDVLLGLCAVQAAKGGV